MNKDYSAVLLEWFNSTDVDVVAIDADDTIWYDSKYFRRLRQALIHLGRACRTEEAYIISALKAALARSPAGEAGYAASILEAATKMGISGEALSRLREEVDALLHHPIELLPHVHESLILMTDYRRVLITKGQKAEQKRKLVQSGLLEVFSAIVILEKKNTQEIKKVFESIRVRCENAIVIGNSIQHDIIPAVQNGARAIWLNHPNNLHGRNGILPKEACEVDGWNPILRVLVRKPPRNSRV